MRVCLDADGVALFLGVRRREDDTSTTDHVHHRRYGLGTVGRGARVAEQWRQQPAGQRKRKRALSSALFRGVEVPLALK